MGVLNKNKRIAIFGVAAMASLTCALMIAWERFGKSKSGVVVPPAPEMAAMPNAYEKAIKSAENGARGGHSGKAVLLARLYHANGDFRRAEYIFAQLLDKRSDQPRLMYLLADCYLQRGEEDKAIGMLRRFVTLEPNYVYAKFRLAEMLMSRGRAKEALDLYKQAIDSERLRPYALLGLARHELRSGNKEAALRILNSILEKNGSFSPARQLQVNLLDVTEVEVRKDRVQSEAEDPKRYIQPPDPWLEEQYELCYDVRKLIVLADRKAVSAEFGKALELLNRAESIDPDFWKTDVVRAVVFLEKGEINKAVGAYREAIRKRPREARLRADLAKLYRKLGMVDEALETLREALSVDPESVELLVEAGRAARESGEVDVALKHLLKAYELHGERPDVARQLAELYFEEGRFGEAVPWMRRSARLNVDDAASRIALSEYHLRKGDFETAIRWGREALQVEPENRRFKRLLGEIFSASGKRLASSGDWNGAIKEWDEAVALMPNDLEFRVQLGYGLLQDGRLADAERLFFGLTDAFPDNPMAYLARGDYHAGRDETRAAVLNWREAAVLLDRLEDPPEALVDALRQRVGSSEFE